MKNFKRILFVLSLLFSVPVFSQEKGEFKLRANYLFEDISFTSNAQGGGFGLSYDVPKHWGLRGGFQYLNKFNDSAPGYRLGGTWWARPSTVLTLDMELAPKQLVVPQQAYTFEISQKIFKVFVPSVGYRFADYASVNSHTLMSSLTWYFFPRFDWMARYFMTVSQFASQSTVKHSAMTRVTWNPISPVAVFGGYSRSNESFESGISNTPAGGFSANHFFTGGSWIVYKGIGIDFSFDYEHRNNGSTVKTYESGVSYRW